MRMGTSRSERRWRWFRLAVAIGWACATNPVSAIEPGDGATAADPGAVSAPMPSQLAKPSTEPEVSAAEPGTSRAEPESKRRRSRLRDFWIKRVRRVQPPAEESRLPASSQPAASSVPPSIFQPGAPGVPAVTGVLLPTPGPSAAAATAPPPSSPAPTPLLLNGALGLQDRQVRVYGWIENSINGDTNGIPRNRENFTIYPDHLSNQWMGNQYYLVLDNPLEQNDTVNFGFRFDMLFGNDWQVTKDYGLFDRAFPINHFAGLDLPQVFGEVHLPILTPRGLDLRAGRFYSLTGFESAMAVSRPLMSMQWALPYTPFTFFGAIGSLHLSDRLNLVLGTVDGYDRWPNEPYKWGFVGSLTWTSRDQKLNIVLGGADAYDQLPRFAPIGAPFVPEGVPPPPFLAGRRNPFYNRSKRGYVSGVLTYKWSDKLTEAVQFDSLFDPMILGYGQDPYIGHAAASYIFAHWFLYQFTDKITGVFRTEVFWDPYGLATGVADTYHEVTLGLNIRPKPWLWFRPEARYDWAQFNHPYNDGTRNSQFTLGLDVIFLF
jgi:hypothetical protein